MAKVTVALDAMGGDYGPQVVVPAALRAIAAHPNLSLILVGHEAALKDFLSQSGGSETDRLRIHHASETVGMDELPSHALRNKKDSSMRVAINLVKNKEAMACVSAGNTGALMVTARFVLKTLPGIERPAIITEIPTRTGKTRMLDLGANVDSCAEHLCQFAVLGTSLVSAIDKIEHPRVGLLNIGAEEIKGNDQVKRTAQLLSDIKDINYIGYVEGDEIFEGVADVVVCDGFVGNVALKVMEGTVKTISSFLRESYQQNVFSKLAALLSRPVINRLKKRVDPARFNGASLVGLNGIVIKSHGSAGELAFYSAIEEAITQVENNVPQLIVEHVTDLLQDEVYE